MASNSKSRDWVQLDTTASSEIASSSGFTVPPVNNAVSGSSTTSDEVSTTAQIPSTTENPSAEPTTSAPQVTPEIPTTTEEPIVTSEPAQTTPNVNTEEPPATTEPPTGPTRVPSADTPAGTYNAVDCYADDEGTGFPLAPPVTDSVDPNHYDTPAHWHCYCSNGLLDAEPNSDCSYECPGDPTQACGAGSPPTRKLRRRSPVIGIIIYELFGWVPPSSSVVTEVIPTETQGVTTTDITTDIIATEEPISTETVPVETLGATSTEIIVTEEPSASTTGETLGQSSTGIPPVNNFVSGSGSTTLGFESTTVLPTDQPSTTTASEIPNTEEPVTSTSQAVNTEQPAGCC
ncbi:hypothetical protein EYC84_009486 [Monilinia fructicola]|uniref:WSC domain-containing protein n=1 Tax=Monilinia fructicola TaxID=38448 RepID=A0A5M9J805_MONFR|nr:hypothetical protein EYC84_009486 [Monilinia fructicola]